MPTRKVKGGYKYGPTGKTYPTKEQADKQGRAIQASKHSKKPVKRGRQGKKKH
jgi:hypothetical protein